MFVGMVTLLHKSIEGHVKSAFEKCVHQLIHGAIVAQQDIQLPREPDQAAHHAQLLFAEGLGHALQPPDDQLAAEVGRESLLGKNVTSVTPPTKRKKM